MGMLIATPTRVTDDRLINQGPCYLLGVAYDCTADGGILQLYDGNDATSGDLKLHSTGWQHDPNPVMPAFPVRFDRGLYVTLDANVADATIFWCHAEQTVNQLTTGS